MLNPSLAIKQTVEAIFHHCAELLLQARFRDAVRLKVVNLQNLVEDFAAYAIKCRLFDIMAHQSLEDSKTTRDLTDPEVHPLSHLDTVGTVCDCAHD
jgi:hypothetical protein